MRKIILIGYMGVGKTTIAQLLAKKMKMKWVDLDEIIENEAGMSITAIFQTKGEIYFRKLEHTLFKKLAESDEPLIISTGGGTPCYADNHLFLNGEGKDSIYLKASIATIFDRLKKEKNHRPLIAEQSEKQLKEFIAKNLFDRSYFYNQATHKIDIDNNSPETITEEILHILS
ncbi:shikimate kinase [Flavobacterium sp. XGLA_31]|uniref:shikimate kinase n=1 Tax=Flavobacterium sp. XGLA_31 TaxID=3447666 RepID=UPI003F3615F8